MLLIPLSAAYVWPTARQDGRTISDSPPEAAGLIRSVILFLLTACSSLLAADVLQYYIYKRFRAEHLVK